MKGETTLRLDLKYEKDPKLRSPPFIVYPTARNRSQRGEDEPDLGGRLPMGTRAKKY